MFAANKYSFLLILAVTVFARAEEPQLLPGGKCGTFDSPDKKKTRLRAFPTNIRYLAGRPVMDTSVLSPSGKFRIHFDTSGINQPAMLDNAGARILNSYRKYVDTVKSIFDSVWRAEIETYKFQAPPADNRAGGGDEYDIYIIHDLANFGETWWEDSTSITPGKPNPRFPSYITVNNDYGTGFRTHGIPALMSTAAHEFHHAIQIGGYGYWGGPDKFFYELSAESMEPTVFPISKDYIFDVIKYFMNIDIISLVTPFSFPYYGYERAIWGIFLMKRYGTDIMREIWEEIATTRPVPAMINCLAYRQKSLRKEYADFAEWNLFSGPMADTVQYYPDGKLFPSVAFSQTLSLNSNLSTVQRGCLTLSSNYIRVLKGSDTTVFIISNVNVDSALVSSDYPFSYQLDVAPYALPNAILLTNGMYARFTVPDMTHWNFAPVSSGTVLATSQPGCFPNPFNPATSTFMVSTDQTSTPTSNLSIFSSAYDLVASGISQYKLFAGKYYIEWNGKDLHGKYVASGVYYYVLVDGDRRTQGKFVVLR